MKKKVQFPLHLKLMSKSIKESGQEKKAVELVKAFGHRLGLRIGKNGVIKKIKRSLLS